MSERTDNTRTMILRNIGAFNDPRAAQIAEQAGISRQAVYKHLRALVAEGLVEQKGSSSKREYDLPILNRLERIFSLKGLDETFAWQEIAVPFLDDIATEERKICQFGFTEMVNNAIDHSEGTQMTAKIKRTSVSVAMSIEDDGIGIFEKIAAALELSDPRLAILELSKGKFTTDASRHSGEGIFFTSRMFDIFIVRSKLLRFIHHNFLGPGQEDWLVEEEQKNTPGTQFFMELFMPTDRTMESVFQQHTDDDSAFSRTHVPLTLAQIGKDFLISRSQARRVLSRFDRFKEVMLDFAGVPTIGQAFADEIFRVFKRQKPEIRVVHMNANPQVSRMIKRAQAAETNE